MSQVTHDVNNILITSGEPAGIGPDLIINFAERLQSSTFKEQVLAKQSRIIVLGDPDLLKERATELGKSIHINCISKNDIGKEFDSQSISVLPIRVKEKVVSGQLNVNNASYVMEILDTAIDLCQKNICQAMLTCPIQKSILLDAGYSLQGHTEYLAEKCNTEEVVMMLANSHLRVALITTHIPLKAVSAALNQEHIIKTIKIIHHDLQDKFAIKNPSIFVCGLNPHAGEDGHLGTEEQTIITPALNKLREQGMDIAGPLPADTIFNNQNREQADVFVAMYHDQGLPVLKALGFGDSINITLGLPIIRTSVDHGTALDLAGKGRINDSSFVHALNTAIQLINQSNSQI